MSLNQIHSTNNYITINGDDNVSISNDNSINFHEFQQATININYISPLVRAKTAFVVRNASNSIAQVSYRNEVVTNSPLLNQGEDSTPNDVKIQYVGGSALLYIQSNIGKTSNISRGIIGATSRRPTGDFDFIVEIWASAVSSGAPTRKIDSFRIKGTIRELFNNQLKVSVIDGNISSLKSYTISLPDNETIYSPYLYGYKFTSIPNYLTIKKGKTTISQGDTIQGSYLEITSKGIDDIGQITFSVCSVDIDKRERNDENTIEVFNFASLPTQTQPITPSGNDVTVAQSDDTKVVVTYPRTSTNVKGFTYYNDSKQPVSSNGSGNPILSIWSDSSTTQNQNLTTEGIIQITFPTIIPSGNTIVDWTLKSNSPIIKAYSKVGVYDQNTEKDTFVSQDNNGELKGSLTINRSDRSIYFDIKSLEFCYGNVSLVLKLSHGDDIAPAIISSLSEINLKVLENPPKSYARNKRVYLYDNTFSYTMDPNLDDSDSWSINSSGANSIDNSLDNINVKYIDGQNASRTFNILYGDDNKLSKKNFSDGNGDLGLFLDFSLIESSIYNESDPNSSSNLAFIVNPNTYNKLSVTEKGKNIWKNNVINGVALNGAGKAKYQVFTVDSVRYTVTEYTRYFNADGSKSNKPDDSEILASGLNSLTNYPKAKISAPVANLFTIPSGDNLNFNITTTDSVDNYFGVVYDIDDNLIIMNPHIKNTKFYGKVSLTYNINDGNLPSFNRASTDIYFMPKVKPIVDIKRYILNESEQLEESVQTSFLSNNPNVKYGVIVTIGDDNDVDYISLESDDNIKNFLKSKHEVHINYSDIIPHESYNGSVKNQQISSGSLQFNQSLSTFAGSYEIDGYDTLNWKVGTSIAMFDFIPNLGIGKYINYIEIPIVPSAGASLLVNTDEVITNLWSSQDVEIFGVPIIKGIRTTNDMTLLGRNDLRTCTTVVIFNDGNNPIDVTVMDMTAYDTDQAGDHPIYLHTQENQHVSIGAGNARVFLRIMFSPEAWEPMDSDYVPSN